MDNLFITLEFESKIITINTRHIVEIYYKQDKDNLICNIYVNDSNRSRWYELTQPQYSHLLNILKPIFIKLK